MGVETGVTVPVAWRGDVPEGSFSGAAEAADMLKRTAIPPHASIRDATSPAMSFYPSSPRIVNAEVSVTFRRVPYPSSGAVKPKSRAGGPPEFRTKAEQNATSYLSVVRTSYFCSRGYWNAAKMNVSGSTPNALKLTQTSVD